MKRKSLLTMTVILVITAMGLISCVVPRNESEPSPPSGTMPESEPGDSGAIPMPAPTDSGSSSNVAELEAQIRQLEAENEELLNENERLRSELAEATDIIQDIDALVYSSEYGNTLDDLSDVQEDTNELDVWASTLPELPALPPGVTPGDIEWAVEAAGELYEIIDSLPPIPPFPPPPPGVQEIENARLTFLEVFEFVEDLEELPEFLSNAQSLDELRSRIDTYLQDVQSTTASAETLMDDVKDVASSN